MFRLPGHDSDFFDSQGEPYIRVGAHTYRVSDGVECYYNRTGNLPAGIASIVRLPRSTACMAPPFTRS